jgi:hypothetical protein
MPIQRDWDQFREQFPELAETVKSNGARIYDMGATQGAGSDEYTHLFNALQDAPTEALSLLGLARPLDSSQVLRAVFSLGAEMLFNLEQGRSC